MSPAAQILQGRSWKSVMLSAFLSEATLNNFWVKFVIMLLSNNQSALQ